ncbi:major facilitator superfamily domain-containing protein [Phthorimaea operculella]|nr:major facilitator superfamily domain-containing protein [Phthorimaea operculella]
MNKPKSKYEVNLVKPVTLGVRHVQVLMMSLAMAVCYSMRVNLSIGIVAMTDTSKQDFFDWNVQTQSVILSSFFWGYIVLQVPGGMLSTRVGSKILLLTTVTINSVVSILLPVAAYHGGWKMVCACRIIQGLSQGFLFPSAHNLLSKWAPLDEKSRFGTFVYAGVMLGMTAQYFVSGFIVSAWGWPAIFYVNGACGAFWVAVYAFIGADTPQSSMVISSEEQRYIEESTGQTGDHKKLKTPWKSIITCVPFLMLMIAHGALPYLAIFVMSFPMGFLADWILKKELLSITNTRKLMNSIGMYGPAIALIGLSYTPPGQLTVAVALLMLVVGINAAQMAGAMLVHIDMAPNFAGTLMGITNCFANIISLIAPLAAGAILNDQKNPSDWRTVFFVASAVYIATNTLFVIFGSSKRQPWNEIPDEENKTENIDK